MEQSTLEQYQSQLRDSFAEEFEKLLGKVKLDKSTQEILTYYFENSGKVVRPILFYLIAKSFGHENDKQLIPFAMTIELMHTMSLYHDDVIDNATIRRGASSVNAKHGNNMAIVAGDTLHSLIHGYLLDEIMFNDDLGQGYSHFGLFFLRDLMLIVEGTIGNAVIQEMEWSKSDTFPTFAKSSNITANKTAPLFAFTTSMGARITQQDKVVTEAMWEFGWTLGTLYQLVDDLKDFFPNEKGFGNDIRENRKTPIAVKLFEKDSDKYIAYRQAIIEHFESDSVKAELLLSIIKENPEIFIEIYSQCKELMKNVFLLFELLPDNKYTDKIRLIADEMEEKLAGLGNLINL